VAEVGALSDERQMIRPSRLGRRRLLVILSITLGACAAGDQARPPSPAVSRLMPDPVRLAGASPALRARLAASPIALFRFVNPAWTREVCTAFAGSLDAAPTVRLHGDAHVEQYAVTGTARGLDDFDDSTRGPAVVDIVRFLGSLELTARNRGWDSSLSAISDAFFEGYRRALDHPDYLPPIPAVAARLRAAPARPPAAFLAWAESLMEPANPSERARFDDAWRTLETDAARYNPAFTPAFLRVRKVGWLRLGVGSALTPKILVRVEGPSAAPDDDVIVEAKEVLPLASGSCLSIPRNAEAFRVVEGVQQLGRINHQLLVALPLIPNSVPGSTGWWIKTWERTYREIEITDLASAEELREVAHDVGAQLGSTNLADAPPPLGGQERLAELEALTRLELRMRQVAHGMTIDLLEAWRRSRDTPER
jgi:uncharacterized protein (DUF2252 family)